MQREIELNEIDWAFCWRTSTGEVRAGARDTGMNGRAVLYQPSGPSPEAGLRVIVNGRVRTCPLPPMGPRLDGQGAISRMCAFVSGYVTEPCLVPARDERELGLLREGARAAVLSGDASAWALAAIRARGEVRWAIHVHAREAVVRELTDRVAAPWTLTVKEKPHGSWLKGAQIFCSDRDGRLTATLEADAIFDEAPLPPFASTWRSEHMRPLHEGGGALIVPYARPTGPGAWERWLNEAEPRRS